MPMENLNEENANPQKGLVWNIIKVVLFSFIVLIVLALISVAGAWWFYTSQVNKKFDIASENGLKLTIKKGQSVEEIASMLKENKLMEYPVILKAYLFLNTDKTIQAGYYELPKGSVSLPDLVDTFQNGSFKHKLTFIEGWRTEEYVDYLKKEMGEDFANKFKASKEVKQGYLFPDTYIIEEGYDPENLASWMRNNYEGKAKAGNWESRAETMGITMDEVVILASMVEREMHISSERPKVAGILMKRWQNSWPIQVDATVQYAKATPKDWWPVVTREDLKSIDSPYNTYLNKGLPPGPICNPGKDSIESVLKQVETPYWFYITGKDGKTYYAETLEQHNINVAQHL